MGPRGGVAAWLAVQLAQMILEGGLDAIDS